MKKQKASRLIPHSSHIIYPQRPAQQELQRLITKTSSLLGWDTYLADNQCITTAISAKLQCYFKKSFTNFGHRTRKKLSAGLVRVGDVGALNGRLNSSGKHALIIVIGFFFSSRRRHTRFDCDWSSDVCSSD